MNPTIKRLLAYCARYPRWLVQAGICLLLATGAEVAGPLLIKLFIDDYLAPRRLEWGIIAALAAGYLGLQVLSAAGFYLQSLRFNRIAQAVVQRLREQVFATAIRLRWTDLAGEDHEEILQGFAAVCAQHEYDHLDGILTLDHLSPADRAIAEGALL